MDTRINIIAWLAGIALTVTVVLYALFVNFSLFESADKSIKLGGSVAFFFILFTTEFTFIKHLYTDSLAPIRKKLSGKWKYIAEVKEKDTAEVSTYSGAADIQQKEGGKINIIGNIDGNMESWEADEVVLTDSKLVYFFDIPVLRMSGVTNLRFANKQKFPLDEMTGYWILSGREGRGNITFSRIPQ